MQIAICRPRRETRPVAAFAQPRGVRGNKRLLFRPPSLGTLCQQPEPTDASMYRTISDHREREIETFN